MYMKKGYSLRMLYNFYLSEPFSSFFCLSIRIGACASHLDAYSANSFSVISLYNIRTASEIYPNNIQHMF